MKAVKAVSEVAGHASTAVTLEIYGHLLPGIGVMVMDNLAGLLAASAPLPDGQGGEMVAIRPTKEPVGYVRGWAPENVLQIKGPERGVEPPRA